MLREFESAGFFRVVLFFALALAGAIFVLILSPAILQADYRGIRSFLP
jgi:hypothetical protein